MKSFLTLSILLTVFIFEFSVANAELICHDAPAVDGDNISTGKICVSNEKTSVESGIGSHKNN